MPRWLKELAHVAVTFAITLGGMLAATAQPITRDLIVSMLPAAAVATMRRLEARADDQAARKPPAAGAP